MTAMYQGEETRHYFQFEGGCLLLKKQIGCASWYAEIIIDDTYDVDGKTYDLGDLTSLLRQAGFDLIEREAT